MNSNTPQNSKLWMDSDDAPEITAADLKRGVWRINGKIVLEAEGRNAFASTLKAISEPEKGTSSSYELEKPISLS